MLPGDHVVDSVADITVVIGVFVNTFDFLYLRYFYFALTETNGSWYLNNGVVFWSS